MIDLLIHEKKMAQENLQYIFNKRLYFNKRLSKYNLCYY